MKMIQTRLTKENFRHLFLGVAFPLHIWTILMVMQDYEWIVLRSNNMLDGVGVAAYALVFTLLESLALTILLSMVSIFLWFPDWSDQKRNSVLLSAFYSILFWGMVGQLVYIVGFNPVPDWLMGFFFQIGRPLIYLTLTGLGLIVGSIVLWVGLGWRVEKVQRGLAALLDRVEPLVYLYLFLDVLAVIVVIVRNVIRAIS